MSIERKPILSVWIDWMIPERGATAGAPAAAASAPAPSPATDPRPSATRGTVPILSTTSSQPATPGTLARPVVSMVFTDPPPPE